jgi:glycerol-3-phosphate acyltransferase PlsY
VDALAVVLLILAGYLLGSFPSGYLIGRAHGIDIRRVGDGNVGMMNVYREVGPAWGLLTFALDILKAAAAVGLGRWVDIGDEATMAAGAAALVGHRYPVTLGFRGGRSAGSATGVVVAFAPLEAAGPLALGVAIIVFARNSVAALAVSFATLLVILLVRQADAGTIAYLIGLPIYAGVNDALDRMRKRRPVPEQTA